LDGFGLALAGPLLGASCDALLSTALYDIEVTVLSSGLVSTEVRELTGSTGGGGDRGLFSNKSSAWSVIEWVTSS